MPQMSCFQLPIIHENLRAELKFFSTAPERASLKFFLHEIKMDRHMSHSHIHT